MVGTGYQVKSAQGLRNYGNTCFANATLQVLLSSSLPDVLLASATAAEFSDGAFPTFDNHNVVRTSAISPNRTPVKLHAQSKTCKWLQRQLLQLASAYNFSGNSSGKCCCDPRELTTNVERVSKCLTNGRQEDAHEYLKAVLEVLFLEGHNKRVKALFDGKLVSEVCCLECGHRRFTPERFVDLSLDVERVNSVEEGLSAFTSTETLSKDNKVDCDGCKRRCQITKGLSISEVPSSILCIHLKRFSYNNYGRLQRISKRISFPLKLDLANYLTKGKENSVGNTLYELFALVIHIGASCNSGHYISYVKRGNIWFLCNDSRVSAVSEKQVLKQNPYMIFYQAAQENNRKATDISAIKIAAQTPASAKRIRMKKENQNPQETKKFSPRSNKEINLAIPPKSIVRPTTSLRRRMSFQKVKRLFSCAISFAGRKGEKVSPRDDDCYGNSDSNSHSNSNKPSVRRSDRLRVNTKKKNDENTRIGTYSPIRFSEYSQWEQQRSYNHSHSLSSPLKRLHSADHIFGSEGGDNKRTMKKARILRSTTTDGSGSSKRTSKRTVRLR